MSMEKRIEALERSYGTETHEEDPAEVARRRAEFADRMERAEEKAAPDAMGQCSAAREIRRGLGPREAEGPFPDLTDTVRETGASPHRSKGLQKYRSSPGLFVHEKAGAPRRT